jgi:hypothetical protein
MMTGQTHGEAVIAVDEQGLVALPLDIDLVSDPAFLPIAAAPPQLGKPRFVPRGAP